MKVALSIDERPLQCHCGDRSGLVYVVLLWQS
jgi:hypothetical protein